MFIQYFANSLDYAFTGPKIKSTEKICIIRSQYKTYLHSAAPWIKNYMVSSQMFLAVASILLPVMKNTF